MKQIAGYRSHDRDTIEFVEVADEAAPAPAGKVLTIEPAQLVLVGDIDLAAAGDQDSVSGEWGRIGPPKSVSDAGSGRPDGEGRAW